MSRNLDKGGNRLIWLAVFPHLGSMSSQELEPKYNYRFSLEAKTGGGLAEEPTKADVDAYIFEALGLKKENAEE